MKPGLGFDTAALVSLGHTDLIDAIIDNHTVFTTNGVINELKEIASRDDPDGEAAERWSEHIDRITIISDVLTHPAEDGVFNICRDRNIPIVTDDVRAISRFNKSIRCFFSVHVVYILYKKGIISRKNAIASCEEMRLKRTWKDNVIWIVARTFFI